MDRTLDPQPSAAPQKDPCAPRLGLGGVMILALSLGVFGCGKTPPPPASTTTPELPADIAPVAAELKAAAAVAQEVSTTIKATGELVSPRRSDLVARWPGRVEAILALEGETVRRGQPLLRLETDYLRLNVTRSDAELERAKAGLLEAEQELARKEELWKRKSIPQASYDRVVAAHAQAKAAVAAAQAAVELGRKQIEDAVLTAPISGVVAERRVEVGERLSDGSIAFVIAELDSLHLRFNLPERHLRAAQPGREVTATFEPFPGETFRGNIVLVGQVIDPATRTFAVEARIDNQDRRLRPGLFARVELSAAAP